VAIAIKRHKTPQMCMNIAYDRILPETAQSPDAGAARGVSPRLYPRP